MRAAPALRRRGFSLPGSAVTPEPAFLARRRFLGDMLAAGACALGIPGSEGPRPRFALDRPLTGEAAAARCRPSQEAPCAPMAAPTVVVTGLCRNRGRFDLDLLQRRFPVEERCYRFRCVEAWAMAVPWLGFPLASLVRWAEPRGHATHVRFVAEGPTPYCEGLRLAEAMNELTLLACGIYGHGLPAGHGAPLRLVVPWKYGFKSIKSVTRIEFTDHEPATFWPTAASGELDFLANVDPAVPHPRWSQSRERLVGTGELRDTLPFNGYGAWVAGLYG